MATALAVQPPGTTWEASRIGAEVDPSARQAMLVAWSIFFVSLGAGWRIIRYALRFPFWGDEGMLCLNFIDQTYLGILEGVKYAQVAPLGFLWSELAIYHLLGGSELAMRLLPTLAGLAAVVVFYRLAWVVLDPLPATLATALLAVGYYPVRHACEVKPYAFDLLTASALLLFAFLWLRQPRNIAPLAGLAALIVPALAFSNPLVFVAGGISLALLPTLWRLGDRRAWLCWLLYNALLLSGFLISLKLNEAMQSQRTSDYLQYYWEEAFPPVSPLELVKWLVEIHTGNMMAYPIGGKYGASTGTFLLFLLGVAHFVRRRQWSVLLLCLAPFGLTFIAAMLHRYPYGVSARVSQHLAPAICLLAATGLAGLFEGLCRTARARRYALQFCYFSLILVAGAGLVRDLRRPYKGEEDLAARRLFEEIAVLGGGHSPVLLLSTPAELQPAFAWYLMQGRLALLHDGETDRDALPTNVQQMVAVEIRTAPIVHPRTPAAIADEGWTLDKRLSNARPLDTFPGVTEYSVLSRWRRPPP